MSLAEFSAFDRQCMARALELAERGLATTDPNPRVGCVIARDGAVLAEGWHERAGEAHAEVNALREAGEHAAGATFYVTQEPCTHFGRTPPCVDAVIAARPARTVIGMVDPNPRELGAGIQRLQAAGIETQHGLFEAEARALNCGFVRRMEQGIPWVRVKLAASLDGRTALANGQSRWITGEAARADVQHWRRRSSAIMTGSGTILHDDPQLNARLADGSPASRQPLRVIADSELRIPASARVLSTPGEVLIFTLVPAGQQSRPLEARGARLEAARRAAGGIDLRHLMTRLGEMEVNEVWVEAGAWLSGALLAAQLVDEVVIYFAPSVLGGDARPMFELPELRSLEERRQLEIIDTRMIGADLRVIARPSPAERSTQPHPGARSS
jgi:diaminohydroxyphosphoribosylaminopyrimidine deaminase/5-amino-6-(5-phosphoribosylamino)uracil reductase